MDSEKEEQEVTYQASPSSFPFDGGWLPRQCFLPRARTKLAFKVRSFGIVQRRQLADPSQPLQIQTSM